jgi:hypothetical protein
MYTGKQQIDLFKTRMGLSSIPKDIIPMIAKYLLKFDISYKFNKYLEKRMIIIYQIFVW